MKYDTALVFGAGAFGTSIASVLSHNFKKVILKVRSEDTYDSLIKGENKIYLPGHQLATNISAALTWDDLGQKIEGQVDLLVFGLPTTSIDHFCQDHAQKIREYLDKEVPVVSLCKGIESETLMLPDEIFHKYFSDHQELFTYLSGPSFAREIVEEQITLVSLAGRSKRNLMTIASMLQTNFFKVFPTYDVKGLLLGGALKNVLAISSGIIEGLGYNYNTRAAMITRGIVEMLRFGRVFNARPETFYGLSGMGDLILTSTGDLSRNKSFGMAIAKGEKPEDIIARERTTVEGYKTSKAAHLLAQKYDIRTRLFDGLYRVLYENAAPEKVIGEMMRAPVKFEEELLF